VSALLRVFSLLARPVLAPIIVAIAQRLAGRATRDRAPNPKPGSGVSSSRDGTEDRDTSRRT
jgi:hypothetical protein